MPKYLCWLALFELSACRPSNLSTSDLRFMYICLQTLSNLLLFHRLIAEPSGLLRLKIPGLFTTGGAFLGFYNGEPSWATSKRGLLGLFSMVSLPGLLHNGAFLGLFQWCPFELIPRRPRCEVA